MKKIIGNINPEEKNVTIIGAGFSGLVLGYYLKTNGFKISILERSNKIGGHVQTKKTSAGFIEKGPNALFMSAEVMDLLKELKLEPLPASKKLKRLIYQNGKPRRIFQLGLLTTIGLNGHKKPPLVSDGLTVAEFFKPLVGEENISKFVSPILGGIYAQGAENLHFKSVFHDVSQMAQFDSYWTFFRTIRRNHKAKPQVEVSGSISFEGGMATLINRLGDILRSDIKLNYKDQFKFKGNTILCTDAQNGAEILKDLRPQLSLELSKIKYQDLTSTTIFLKKEIRPLQRSFGVLIPRESTFHSIGILNNKAIFPQNTQTTSSYTFIAPKKCTEEEIFSDVKSLWNDFSAEDVESIEQTYWERALPIYNLQRYLGVKKLHQLAREEKNIAIFGNYVAGISLRDMVVAAKTFALNPKLNSEVK